MNAHTTEEEKKFIQKLVYVIKQDPSYEVMPSDCISLEEYLTELTVTEDCRGTIYLGIIYALETYLNK